MDDKLYFRAKHEGYRARSVYKLIELQRKYRIIKKRDAVLELGCAPGSWLQIGSKWIGNGFILGVDIAPVKPLENDNIIVWKEDVMADGFPQKLEKFLAEKRKTGFSAILSDMAPKTKGIPYIDQRVSFELAARVFEIARTVLACNGNIVCKVFQSREAADFLQVLKKSFHLTKMVEVEATKRGSKEMYYVCLGYKKD